MAMAKTPSLKPSSERTLIRNEPPDGDETLQPPHRNARIRRRSSDRPPRERVGRIRFARRAAPRYYPARRLHHTKEIL
jgi:hypothetical protein